MWRNLTGSLNIFLPPGLLVMGTYEADLAKIEASHQELANAEKLFDLPITMYPELLNMQKEMSGLRQIYRIYEEQKVVHSVLVCFVLKTTCNIEALLKIKSNLWVSGC